MLEHGTVRMTRAYWAPYATINTVLAGILSDKYYQLSKIPGQMIGGCGFPRITMQNFPFDC